MKFPSRTNHKGQSSTIKNITIINIGSIRLLESDFKDES